MTNVQPVYLYVLFNISSLRIYEVSWEKRHYPQLDYTPGHFITIVVPIPSLTDLVKQYFAFRKLKWAETKDAAMHFLTSETGEVADALVSEEGGWIRNNPENKAGKSVPTELGDVLMMATVLSSHYGVDPLQGMLAKFRTKGFDQMDFHSEARK